MLGSAGCGWMFALLCRPLAWGFNCTPASFEAALESNAPALDALLVRFIVPELQPSASLPFLRLLGARWPAALGDAGCTGASFGLPFA